MSKLIVEVGSTVTKVDELVNNELVRIKEKTILFKKHYKELKKIDINDLNELIKLVNDLKEKSEDIYVCGTSIFRDLTEEERNNFLAYFKKNTNYNFETISATDENYLTVLGATRSIKEKVCIFIGGGGSTEITIYNNGILETANSNIGVIDAMENYKDLTNDFADSNIEEIKTYIKSKLNLPKEKSDILILAGGAHERFIKEAHIKHEKNTIYNDPKAPFMMDIETRRKETERFFKNISLNEIKERVEDPAWWDAARMMTVFILVVAESIGAKYIIPTDLGMSYGIIEKLKEKQKDEK